MFIHCPRCDKYFEVPDPVGESSSTEVPCNFCGSRVEVGAPQTRPAAPAPRPVKSDGCVTALKVAGIGCLVLFVLGLAGGLYVAMNFKRIATDLARATAVRAIRASDMPREMQDGFVGHIDRVARAYKEGRISTDQVMRIFKNVAESPLFPVAMVMMADRQYVQPSGLAADEKRRATRDLQRLARGIAERNIRQEDLEEILNIVSSRQVGGGRKVRQKLSDAEVRALAAKVKGTVDAAGVPDEPYEVDCVAEFGQAIDRELEGKGEIRKKPLPPEPLPEK
jgi:hypothetical protein